MTKSFIPQKTSLGKEKNNKKKTKRKYETQL